MVVWGVSGDSEAEAAAASAGGEAAVSVEEEPQVAGRPGFRWPPEKGPYPGPFFTPNY